MTNNFRDLEESLGYKFNNISFLTEALSHPSLKQAGNNSKNYERLEFLGDSILGFIITEMVFYRFNKNSEGDISQIKAHSVSRASLVQVANRLNLSRYIIMSEGEEISGGRSNPNNIENAMEALLAAIYLDGGLSEVVRIVNFYWKDLIENIDFNYVNPKTSLQELSQKKFNQAPKYEIIKQEGSSHEPIFTVQVIVQGVSETAQGKSIKEAEKISARKMLNKLKNND